MIVKAFEAGISLLQRRKIRVTNIKCTRKIKFKRCYKGFYTFIHFKRAPVTARVHKAFSGKDDSQASSLAEDDAMIERTL
jgi:hypothetical protein